MLARASITHTGFNCAKKIRLEASGGFEKGLPKKAHCAVEPIRPTKRVFLYQILRFE